MASEYQNNQLRGNRVHLVTSEILAKDLADVIKRELGKFKRERKM